MSQFRSSNIPNCCLSVGSPSPLYAHIFLVNKHAHRPATMQFCMSEAAVDSETVIFPYLVAL